MTETKRSKNGILIQKCTNRPEKKKKQNKKARNRCTHIRDFLFGGGGLSNQP